MISEQQARLKELRTQAIQLDEAVSADAIQAKMESCLSNVDRHRSYYAKQIDLEYSGSPLRRDPAALPVAAETPERGVPMREIGSGETLVGYHIVAQLALHTSFANPDRPVPAFRLLGCRQRRPQSVRLRSVSSASTTVSPGQSCEAGSGTGNGSYLSRAATGMAGPP